MLPFGLYLWQVTILVLNSTKLNKTTCLYQKNEMELYATELDALQLRLTFPGHLQSAADIAQEQPENGQKQGDLMTEFQSANIHQLEGGQFIS